MKRHQVAHPASIHAPSGPCIPDFRTNFVQRHFTQLIATASLDIPEWTSVRKSGVKLLVEAFDSPNASLVMEKFKSQLEIVSTRLVRDMLRLVCVTGFESTTFDRIATLYDMLQARNEPDFGADLLLLSLQHGHLALAHHILDVMPTEHDSVETADQVLAALNTRNEDLVLRCLNRPATKASIEARVDDDDDWLVDNEYMLDWVVQAVQHDMHKVVSVLETQNRLYPAIHQYCFHNPNPAKWIDVSERYRRLNLWAELKDSLLVQRRRIGLPDHVGMTIGSYLYTYDPARCAHANWCIQCHNCIELCACQLSYIPSRNYHEVRHASDVTQDDNSSDEMED
ncbi:Aste57867_13004 [Aphanomyces stellatus]|uniref:Aste57867_13004 protein n=1 Tax=Aphanomyces stellatus TaxID=120398 RepID=A0A485KXD5_9STRA|nr:hypothetical protein As57867_012956 [Aphanomyces stellatus]VFT89850.1 Aste57867_13004 [Aphanomyces stellatus]